MAGNDRLYLRDGGTVDTGNGGAGTDWARRDRRDRVRNVERFG